jgi:hypothetical protein
MDGGCRTGQVVDFIHFHEQGESDVMAHEFKIGIGEEVSYIVLGPGEKVVGADDFMAFPQ